MNLTIPAFILLIYSIRQVWNDSIRVHMHNACKAQDCCVQTLVLWFPIYDINQHYLKLYRASFRQIINIQHWLLYRSNSFHAFSPNSYVFSYLRHHPPPPRIHVNVPCVGSKVHIPVHLLHMHMLDELLRVSSSNTLAVFKVVWATIQNDNRKTNMHIFSKSNKT